ncbi:MAG: HNH endonuclease, partial [Acidobacteriota bacterium]
TDQNEAARRLNDDNLWDASYHIFPAAGDDTRSYDLNISEHAERLRFASINDRLILNDGQVNPQQLQSMRQLTTETAKLLRSILGDASDNLPDRDYSDTLPADDFPDELEPGKSYVEGAKKQVLVNAYERDSRARSDCLKHYGYDCVVCGFNFESSYGERGKDYIHVHHLKPISLTDGQYELDPLQDLRPVCPNCHAMLHRGKQLLSIEELKDCLQNSGSK